MSPIEKLHQDVIIAHNIYIDLVETFSYIQEVFKPFADV